MQPDDPDQVRRDGRPGRRDRRAAPGLPRPGRPQAATSSPSASTCAPPATICPWRGSTLPANSPTKDRSPENGLPPRGVRPPGALQLPRPRAGRVGGDVDSVGPLDSQCSERARQDPRITRLDRDRSGSGTRPLWFHISKRTASVGAGAGHGSDADAAGSGVTPQRSRNSDVESNSSELIVGSSRLPLGTKIIIPCLARVKRTRYAFFRNVRLSGFLMLSQRLLEPGRNARSCQARCASFQTKSPPQQTPIQSSSKPWISNSVANTSHWKLDRTSARSARYQCSHG